MYSIRIRVLRCGQNSLRRYGFVKKYSIYFLVLVFIAVVALSGCEKKKEAMQTMPATQPTVTQQPAPAPEPAPAPAPAPMPAKPAKK
jgi:hypothetical protein